MDVELVTGELLTARGTGEAVAEDSGMDELTDDEDVLVYNKLEAPVEANVLEVE